MSGERHQDPGRSGPADERAARRELARQQAARSRRRGRRLSASALVLVVVAAVIAGVSLAGGGDQGPVVMSMPASTPPAAAAGTTPPPTTGDAVAWDRRDPASWPQQGAAAQGTPVPILMYHLIAQAPAGAPYPELWVPPAEFAAHVDALAAAGFTGVTLNEVWDAWHGSGRLPAKPVVLSFDDGSYSQVLAAGPVLLKQGWPGVLNLAVNHVGNDGIPAWGVKRLQRQGWTIDSHSMTHPDVTTLDAAQLQQEIAGSRAAIQQEFGVTPRFFCYPAGRNDAASRAAVVAAGYDGATTTVPGIAKRSDDPAALPRLRVDPGMSGAAVVGLAQGTSTPSAGGGAG